MDRRTFINLSAATGGSVIMPNCILAQETGVTAPVPPILSVDEVPPAQSAPIKLSEAPQKRMKMHAESDNSSRNALVLDTPQGCMNKPDAVLTNYWDGKPAADYVLTLRQFWRLVDDSYTIVDWGGSQSTTLTSLYGISETDSQTISATLGFTTGDGPGLSGSITDTFSKSVTTNKEDTTSVVKNISSPPQGYRRVWMSWQLVHEIVALDRNGKQLSFGDRYGDNNRKADISWFCLNGLPFGTSGAWVWYVQTRWLFPSKQFRPAQKDFAI